MGLADVITRRFYDQIDFAATYQNVLTTGFLERGKLPVVAATDEEALAYALLPCRLRDLRQARIMKIKNTLRLDELWVSPAVLTELRPCAHITETPETAALDLPSRTGKIT